MKIKQKKDGFTIIEVVLVLAIAGLIFLMVFIAWPALQRSQRDTQRRNDYSMLSTAVSSYISNNGGKLSTIAPTNGTAAELTAKDYINKDGTDPEGKNYILKAITCTGTDGSKCTNGALSDKPEASNVWVVVGADCSASPNGYAVPTKTGSSNKAFAIYGYLESGSKTFCSASQ
ncbi:MAG: type II secretion system protein [Candidatus Saccharibacteria bacterium]|nr:type II secretion system protein [Candidatus Saccharibacteria bacterium]